VQRAGSRNPWFSGGTHCLEIAFGLTIQRYFLTYVLLGVAAVLFIRKPPARRVDPVIRRLRPGHDAAYRRHPEGSLPAAASVRGHQAGSWDWKFFSGHAAFPSGHSAFFWGLFFPLAFVFPRYRIPLLIIPVFITIARVG
jgi:membrane-associated phospholipid phosphatase